MYKELFNKRVFPLFIFQRQLLYLNSLTQLLSVWSLFPPILMKIYSYINTKSVANIRLINNSISSDIETKLSANKI